MICELCDRTLSEALCTQRPASYSVRHHTSFQNLRASAEDGCDACRAFQAGVIRAAESDAFPETGRWFPENDTTTSFLVSSRWKSLHPATSREQLGCSRFSYEVQQDVDTGASPLFRVTLLSGDHPSLTSQEVTREIDLDVALGWITTCAERHDQCPALEDMELPTRLIDVGSESKDPCLVRTAGLRGRYVALSHRWGNSTLPQNHRMEEHHRGIAFSNMPDTFRDAVHVVRNLGLGLRYLWIDWYCIKQGDPEDFESECARMYSTFANATLTICGTETTSVRSGFLNQRMREDLYGDSRIEISLMLHDQRTRISIEEEVDAETRWKHTYSELAKRAWIIQERLLSPRVLYFGKHQMFMECCSADFFENLRYPITASVYPFSKAVLGQSSSTGPLQQWLSILKEYSRCDITKADDRLPALSGTARLLKDNLQCEYYAGLWSMDPIVGLSWFCSPRGGWRTSAPQELARSQTPLSIAAPSWSWTSCNYGIAHAFLPHYKRTDYSEVLHIHATPIGENPFGQVSGENASLVLRGTSRWIKIRCDMEADGWRPVQDAKFDLCAYPVESSNSSSPIAEVNYNRLIRKEESETWLKDRTETTALLLLMACRSTGGLGHADCPLQWYALVIVPDDNEESTISDDGRVYRRIGLIDQFIGDGSAERALGPKRTESRNKSRQSWHWVSGGPKKTVEIK